MPPSPSASPQGAPDEPSLAAGRVGAAHYELDNGARLGKYRIARRIGHGGMGIVYEADDTDLQRKVAIKVLPELASASPEIQDRFQREARAAARLNHSNVVAVYDVGRQEGIDFLVMEMVPGTNAQSRIESEGAIPWRKATRILYELCRGVAAAHGAGLIHRDIKPGNVMLAPDGQIKLADFGLVKAVGSSVATLTGSGSILGTPLYMSPEQCRAEPVDERSDIYSLGATYFALLTGRPPYLGELPVQIMYAHCMNPAPDPRGERPEVPGPCAMVVQKAMAKEPSERYPTAKAMIADLRAVLEGGAIAAAPASVAPTVVVGEAARPSPPPPRTVRASKRHERPWAMYILGGLAIVFLGGLIAHFVEGKKGAPPSTAPKEAGREAASAPFAEPAIGGGQTPANPVPRMDTGVATAPTNPTNDPAPPPKDARPKLPLDPPATIDFRARLRDQGLDLRIGGMGKALAFSPDGRRFAAGASDNDGGATVWSFETGQEELRRWKGRGIFCLTFSRDGKELVAASQGELLVWDMELARETRIPTGRGESSVFSVDISPDGKTLVAGLPKAESRCQDGVEDDCVLIADVASAKTRLVPEKMDWPWSVAFSPDGRLLAAASLNWKVTVWDFPALTRRQVLMTDNNCYCLAFSPDSRSLAVAGKSSIQVWDPAAGTQVGVGVSVHGEGCCVAFSPDGRLLATGDWQQLTLWDFPEMRVRGTLEGTGGRVSGAAFSADSTIIAVAGEDGLVRLRDVSKVAR